MARVQARFGKVQLKGMSLGASPTKVFIEDDEGKVLLATGTTVPTGGTNGFAKGAIFIDTDVAAGTGGTYLNKGTKTSCDFTLVTQG